MQAHPLAELFPLMTGQDFEGLKRSIRQQGLLSPITVLEDKILDGRNRYRACEELNIDPMLVQFGGDDPLEFVIGQNLTRRHLDESQRGMVAAKIATLSNGRPKKTTEISAVSQTSVAQRLNVSTDTLQAAKRVQAKGSTQLQQAVEQGKIAVSAAQKLVTLSPKDQADIALEADPKERRRKTKEGKERAREQVAIEKQQKRELVLTAPLVKLSGINMGPFSLATWAQLTTEEKDRVIKTGFDNDKTSLNEQTNEAIEWARFSHNAVSGCKHDCPYCYARDIASSERFTKIYPFKFEPTFHPARLAGPGNTKIPLEARADTSYRNIFANSMSDLFGQWVPKEWIDATVEMARRHPKWNFLTLTKFPIRAAEFEFPENWWLGTTVDAQSRVANAEKAFQKIQCKTNWLSCEPMLTPLRFTRLDLFQWVVVGGASESAKTPAWVPPFDWVVDLQQQARAAGCRIYHKTNLGLMDAMRVKEFPWQKPKERQLPSSFKYLKEM